MDLQDENQAHGTPPWLDLIQRWFFWLLITSSAAFLFAVAGWMIVGILGTVVAWALFTLTGQDHAPVISTISTYIGIIAGIIAALWLTIDQLKELFNSPNGGNGPIAG